MPVHYFITCLLAAESMLIRFRLPPAAIVAIILLLVLRFFGLSNSVPFSYLWAFYASSRVVVIILSHFVNYLLVVIGACNNLGCMTVLNVQK